MQVMDSSEGTAQRQLLAQNCCCWNDQINNDLGGKGKGEGDNLPMKASIDSRREEPTAGWLGARLFSRKRKLQLVRIIKGCNIKEPKTGRTLVNINK